MPTMTDPTTPTHDHDPPESPAPRRPRPATDRIMGRPVAETSLTKPQQRMVATLAGDRERITELENMLERARKDRDKHVRKAIQGGLAKALIARTLDVSATTVSKLYGAGAEVDDA